MERITKTDVLSMLDSVNQNLPQVEKRVAFLQKINYYYSPTIGSFCGGWLFVFHDSEGKKHVPTPRRMSTEEAYHFLQGVLFTVTEIQ